MAPPNPDPLPWLLAAHPAIRYQTLRELTPTDPATLAAARARIPQTGFAADLLALQRPDGAWQRDDDPRIWLPTLFTLLYLRAAAVDPADPAIQSAITRLASSLVWNDDPNEGWNLRPLATGGNPFFHGEEEPCINGGVLALSAYFLHPSEPLARRLLREQLPDGGWNCEAPRSTRSSFHTTICVLEGLLAFEQATASTPPTPFHTELTAARLRAEDYLLQRHLFRRLSTGQTIDPAFLQLAFPPRYHYDILRALDYFRTTGAPPDPRLDDALQILASRRHPDGRWPLDHAYDEALPLPFHETPGDPSPWNTLRALRVLHWSQRLPA